MGQFFKYYILSLLFTFLIFSATYGLLFADIKDLELRWELMSFVGLGEYIIGAWFAAKVVITDEMY